MKTASSARPNALSAIAIRRPCWKRSSTGPITGATTANGAIVISRYSSTLPRWSLLAAEKNTVPARATVIIASAPKDSTWFQMSWVSPNSAAPSARLAAMTLPET